MSRDGKSKSMELDSSDQPQFLEVCGDISVGRLAAIMMHDAKNILTTALGQIELAEIGKDEEKNKKRLNKAKQSCLTLNETFESIALISNFDASQGAKTLDEVLQSLDRVLARRFHRCSAESVSYTHLTLPTRS